MLRGRHAARITAALLVVLASNAGEGPRTPWQWVRMRASQWRTRPSEVGGHKPTSSPFTILRFSEPDLPDVVYLEPLTNAVYLGKAHDTQNYIIIMDRLCIQAKPPTDTPAFLERIIEESRTSARSSGPAVPNGTVSEEPPADEPVAVTEARQ